MDKNKQYYLDLVERWFDAETSEAEESDLRAFVAATDDPDFDAVRATMGYCAAEAASDSAAAVNRSDWGLRKPCRPHRTAYGDDSERSNSVFDVPSPEAGGSRRLITVFAIAASVAVAFFIGRMSATPVELVVSDSNACVSYVHGVEVPGEEFAVREMESTLGDLFAPAASPDPAEELSSMFSNLK